MSLFSNQFECFRKNLVFSEIVIELMHSAVYKQTFKRLICFLYLDAEIICAYLLKFCLFSCDLIMTKTNILARTEIGLQFWKLNLLLENKISKPIMWARNFSEFVFILTLSKPRRAPYESKNDLIVFRLSTYLSFCSLFWAPN